MIVQVKFKNEEQTDIICESIRIDEFTYTLHKAFISNQIYDNIVIERENIDYIEW